MKTIIEFQSLIVASEWMRPRSAACGGRMVLLLVLLLIQTHLQGFGQGVIRHDSLTPRDFDVFLQMNPVNGHDVYTVTAILKAGHGFSAMKAWRLLFRIHFFQKGIALTGHVGTSAFEHATLVAAPSTSTAYAYDAELHCWSDGGWVGAGQPWVAWSFSVADGLPLPVSERSICGLVQIDVIEGLRPNDGDRGYEGCFTEKQVAAPDHPIAREAGANPDVILFPNPCVDEICLRFAEVNDTPEWVKLWSPEGEMVAATQGGFAERCFDVRLLPLGTYLIQYAIAGRTFVKRFVKQ